MLKTTAVRYRNLRRKYAMMPANQALRMAKYLPEPKWERDQHDRHTRDLGNGLTAILRVEDESIYPKDDDGYGRYVQEDRRHDYDWQGNYPKPSEDLPLGLPYTTFRYSGPGWVQGEGSGYFIPDNVEDLFSYFRRQGQSKSVSWDLTRSDVERQLSELFGGPLTYCTIVVEIQHDGVTLGSAAIGTTYIDEDDVLTCAEDYGLVDEAMDEAREHIAEIRNLTI